MDFVAEIQPFDGDVEDIDKDWKGFRPVLCLDCKATAGFEKKLFSLPQQPKTVAEEEAVREQLKGMGIDHFGTLSSKNKAMILTAACLSCHSQNTVWDF